MTLTGYPTPDPVSPQTFRCARIYVPDSVGDVFFSLVMGQLAEMTKEYYWKQSGLLTPEQAAFLMAQSVAMTDANGVDCGDAQFTESGDCNGYEASSSLISYYPQNPYSQPGYVPSGYLTAPFTRFGDFPVIGWLSEWFPTFGETLTGYLPDDIIVDISSFPLSLDWDDLINSILPQISIDVSGTGIAELHLINFPLGGRAIVTVDAQPNLVDIFLGILGEAEVSVELNRDIISLPIESTPTVIQEIEITDGGYHTIYITFVPVLDDSSIPFNFGGGLRKVVLCGLDEYIMPIVSNIRLNNCILEQEVNGQWVAVGDVNACVTAITDLMQTQIDANTTNINTNAGDITTLEGRVDTLETNQANHALSIQQNADAIGSLQLDAIQQALTLQDHETRITALEQAGGAIIGTPLVATSVSSAIITPITVNSVTYVDAVSLGHTFTYNAALIVMSFVGRTINEARIGYGRIRLDTQYSTNYSTFRGTSDDYSTIHQAFTDIPTGQYIPLVLQLAGDTTGTLTIPALTSVTVSIIEYNIPLILNDPVVTFDDGGAPYTLPVGQDGIVSSGGNPSNCLFAQSISTYIEVAIDLGESKQIDNINFDYYTSNDLNYTAYYVYVDDIYIGGAVMGVNTVSNAWDNYDTATDDPSPISYPQTGQVIRVRLSAANGATLQDLRMDNVEIQTT